MVGSIFSADAVCEAVGGPETRETVGCEGSGGGRQQQQRQRQQQQQQGELKRGGNMRVAGAGTEEGLKWDLQMG